MTSSASWERLERVFHAALERPPAERQAFVAAECGSDTKMRERVTALLTAASSPSDPLTAAVRDTARDLTRRHSLVGQRLGAYDVVDELGRGGMGRVYLGERADGAFHARVAIKVVSAGHDRSQVLKRFQAEREILASLVHPNIARLLDAGQTDDGLPYMVMEYVDGVPIDRYCDAAGLGVRERVRLFMQLCDAVQFAHDRQIVHRDLKPANIFVPADGTPKLLDFGIAKVLPEGPRAFIETATISAGGPLTLSYGTPEQVRGEPITVRTDVYALGLVLYELLTGTPAQVFEAITPRAVEEIICHTVPSRPSAAAARAGDPAVTARAGQLSGDLDTIVMMALRKEPEGRYPSARGLSDDLQRHLDGLLVRARRDSWPYRVERVARRHRTRIVVGVALAAAAGVGLRLQVAAAVRGERLREARDVATQISSALTAGTIRPDDARFDSLLLRAPQLADALAADRPEHLAFLDVLSRAQLVTRDYDAADESLTRAVTLARAGDSAATLHAARRLRELADVRRQQGDAAGAAEFASEAVAIFERERGPASSDVLLARTALAYAIHELGLTDSALAILSENRERIRRGPRTPEAVASDTEVHMYAAEELQRAGRLDDARTLAQQAVSLAQSLPANHPARLYATAQVKRLAVAARRDGPFAFLPAQQWRSPVAGRREVVPLDVNGDGKVDLAWNARASRGENAVVVALAGADGRFTLGPAVRHPRPAPDGGWAQTRLVSGDFDGDGASDLAWVARRDGDAAVHVAYSRRDATFRFAAAVTVPGVGAGGDAGVVARDVSGDGRADLIWADPQRLRVSIVLARADGGFEGATSSAPNIAAIERASLHLGDVNGDGRTDLVWSSLGEFNRTWVGFVDSVGRVEWLGPEEHGARGIMENSLGAWAFYRTFPADVDGDGRDDLVWSDPASPFPPANSAKRVYVGRSVPPAAGRRWRYDALPFQDGAAHGTDVPLDFAAGRIGPGARATLVWNERDGVAGVNRLWLARAGRGTRLDFSGAPILHPGSDHWSSARLFVMDANGDGRDDLVWVVGDGALRLHVALTH